MCLSRRPLCATQWRIHGQLCNPATGWEKGQVEKNVRDPRNRLWQVMLVFKDLAALNQWLEDRHARGVLSARHRPLGGDTAQGLTWFRR